MNLYYAKTILYAYPNIDSLTEQIDQVVESKALGSIMDFRPCLEQCYSILDLTYYKDCLFSLKLQVEKLLSKLREKDLELIEYKYFRNKKREDLIYANINSRGYYRRQALVIEKVAVLLESVGVDDTFFEKNYLTNSFFKQLLKRTIEHEKSYEKARKMKAKTLKVSFSVPNKLIA
jgi:hypothetical protein